jgi:hypothetical protein
MAKVFINYRRHDTAGYAGRIHDRLKSEFGDDIRIFMDVATIPLGADFAKYIAAEVEKSDLLLVVIGHNWLTVQDDGGNRRLDNPNDLVRLEIAAALARGIPVIPIVLDGARFPKPDELPEDIKGLSMRNGIDVRHASFPSDMGRLINELNASTVFTDRRPASAETHEPPALQLTVGEDDSFVTRKGDGLYKTKRTLHVRLSNNGASRAISNCKVQIISIEPEYGSSGSWVLKQNFPLSAGDDVYIPLARYGEASTVSNHHDTVIEMCMPEGTPISRIPLLEANDRHRLTIRATGVDTPFVELRCELWIDEKGLLRVQDTTRDKGNRITLREAALRAHEQLRNCQIAIFAGAITETESDLLAWYCNRMAIPHDGKPPLVTLYGRQPPSRIIEPIDTGYFLRYILVEIDGEGSIVLKERHGSRQFVDLCVEEGEVAVAIKQMSTWPA